MTRMLDAYSINQGKVWEGLPGSGGLPALKAYKDPAGVPTIGYGHTAGVKMGDVCTQAQAEAYLQTDLMPTCSAVEHTVKATLNDHQFAALVWFAFNVGIAAFRNSTLVRKLNSTPPDYDAVPAQLALWTKITVGGKKVTSKGLVNRRALETTLWLLPVDAIKPLFQAQSPPLAAETTPTLTTSDLRQVETTSATPVPPPTSARSTRTGQGALASIASGLVGAVFSGAQQAQQLNYALQSALNGTATDTQWFKLVAVLLAVGSVGFAVYIFFHEYRGFQGNAE